jgi:hypothetical protein
MKFKFQVIDIKSKLKHLLVCATFSMSACMLVQQVYALDATPNIKLKPDSASKVQSLNNLTDNSKNIITNSKKLIKKDLSARVILTDKTFNLNDEKSRVEFVKLLKKQDYWTDLADLIEENIDHGPDYNEFQAMQAQMGTMMMDLNSNQALESEVDDLKAKNKTLTDDLAECEAKF